MDNLEQMDNGYWKLLKIMYVKVIFVILVCIYFLELSFEQMSFSPINSEVAFYEQKVGGLHITLVNMNLKVILSWIK